MKDLDDNFTKFELDRLYHYIINSRDIDETLRLIKVAKEQDIQIYNLFIERLKILYVSTDEYDFLSTASLIFGELKIHSAVHLIVAKLLSGKFDDCGGTFLYSLFSLRKTYVKEDLRNLWSRNISWEMKQKLEMMKIYPVVRVC
jgi:hypothetical protein